MPEIVPLKPNDWEALREIRLRAVKEEPSAFGATWKDESEKTEEEWKRRLTEGSYFAAKENGSLVGITRFVVQKGEMLKHIAEIFSMYVIPEARGKGIGRMLMETALTELKKIPGMLKVRLTVAVTQKEAQALYESIGFKRVGLFEKEGNLNGHYVDVQVMEKFLR